MVEDQPKLMVEATADALTEEEALLEPELPTKTEPALGMTMAIMDIQIPTWNLGE
jgi:hypothetical protein